MFKSILVPIDLEQKETWDDSMAKAVEIARREGADVHLLTVIHKTPAVVSQFLPKGYEKQVSDKAREALAELAASVDAGSGKVTSTVVHGDVYQEILATAEKVSADLIVLESHKPGMQDYLLGSNAARVVRHASCSVFVLRVDNR